MGVTLQSLLFQMGGITAIGSNSLMMGAPALLCAALFRVLKGGTAARHVFAGALAGGLGVIIAALFLAGFLFLSNEDFWGVAKLAIAWHVVVAGIETAISACTISFLCRVKPETIGFSPLSRTDV